MRLHLGPFRFSPVRYVQVSYSPTPMDFKKMTDQIGDLAEKGGDIIEDAAEALRDKVVDLVPELVKEKAEDLGDQALDAATSLVGKAADKLSGK